MAPKRVLVIGGGPAGLVSLRNLTEIGQFERVELAERRDDVGGVWYVPPKNLDLQSLTRTGTSTRPTQTIRSRAGHPRRTQA